MKDRSWFSGPHHDSRYGVWTIVCRPVSGIRMPVYGLSRREVYRKAILQRRHFVGMQIAARLTK